MNNLKENHISFKQGQAGLRMVSNVPRVLESDLVESVIKILIQKARDFKTINYIYTVNEKDQLVGVISIKEIFSLPKDKPLGNFTKKDIVSVHPHSHQERAAMLSIKHGLKSVPVIDRDQKFLGVVPSDAILNILHEEHIEDALRSGGFTITSNLVKDIVKTGSGTYFKKRLPWLIFGLGGGILAAFVIGFFENILNELLTLVAFLPVIVYMADAVGVQTQTVFIRSLTIDPNLNFKKYLWREISVGFGLALVLGAIISLISFWFWQPKILGLILGFSLFITIIVAMLIALFLPWLFIKMRYDPAIASGPFATTIRDLLSVLIYLGLATIML